MYALNEHKASTTQQSASGHNANDSAAKSVPFTPHVLSSQEHGYRSSNKTHTTSHRKHSFSAIHAAFPKRKVHTKLMLTAFL